MAADNGIARYRLWPRRARWPLLRLGLGIVLAPLLATAMIWGVAFVIAGMSATTVIGVRAIAANAAETYLQFAATLIGLAVIPAIGVLWLLGKRGRTAWVLAGLGAGAVAAGLLALNMGSGLVPAAPIGAGSALFMIMMVRWIAGVRRDREAD